MTPEVQEIMGRIFKAGTLSLVLCLIVYPFYIKYLRWRSFGQQIRLEGPENHYAKKDTPTMGGLVIILAALISAGIFIGHRITLNFYIFTAMVLAAMFLGLSDDYSKILKKESLGMRAREKITLQILMACFLAFFIIMDTSFDISIKLPFVGGIAYSKISFWLFAMMVYAGAVNAVNLTDGLDGLAAGTCAVSFLAYMVICYKNQMFDLAIASFALCCACVGFLWFNAYPAKIFMGDTGSLALGSALGTLAIFSRTEFLLIVIGGIFVAEALSVILQVSYFKITKGKRIFKMSPLHHHFEKSGWHEVEVTIRFWIISLMLAVIGLLFYFREFIVVK